MRPYSQASKQNLRSIVNQKNSILRMKSGIQNQSSSKPFHLSSNTTSVSNLFHKQPSNKLGILHKFIENGSKYSASSRRESLESKVERVSIEGLKFMEDTTNYSDEIRTLKTRNKELQEENRELRKMIEGDKIRLSNVSSQKSFNLNSFDFVNLLEDSNNILKRKLEQSRKVVTLNEEREREEKGEGEWAKSSIDRMYSKGFTERIFPQPTTLIRVVKEHIQEYDNLFIKIRFLTQHVQASLDQKHIQQLNQLVFSIKQSILHRNKPDTDNRGSESKNTIEKRLKSKTKSSRKEIPSLLQTFAPEMLSPEDTFKMLERILQKISKSFSMLETLREKPSLYKLIKKIL